MPLSIFIWPTGKNWIVHCWITHTHKKKTVNTLWYMKIVWNSNFSDHRETVPSRAALTPLWQSRITTPKIAGPTHLEYLFSGPLQKSWHIPGSRTKTLPIFLETRNDHVTEFWMTKGCGKEHVTPKALSSTEESNLLHHPSSGKLGHSCDDWSPSVLLGPWDDHSWR